MNATIGTLPPGPQATSVRISSAATGHLGANQAVSSLVHEDGDSVTLTREDVKNSGLAV